jgi:CheY-like chemotaxis protein
MSIGLIEDNLSDIELTKIALRKAAIDTPVAVFLDGAEALSQLADEEATGKFNLKMLFLDLKLPKINGFEVLERLRSKPHFVSIPIIILTSSAVESDVQRAYELGANSYIVKPINYLEHANAVTLAVRYWTEINTLPDA